jgi:hypothetical protein
MQSNPVSGKPGKPASRTRCRDNRKAAAEFTDRSGAESNNAPKWDV